MAEVKIRVELNKNAENENIDTISNSQLLANLSIERTDNIFNNKPAQETKGANYLSFSQGALAFNDNGAVCNLDDRVAGVLGSEKSKEYFIWTPTDENGELDSSITITLDAGTDGDGNPLYIEEVIFAGNKEARQYPIKATIDGGNSFIFSDDSLWIIKFPNKQQTQSITFLQWSRPNYNAMLTYIGIQLQYFDITNTFLNDVSSLTQSTSNAGELFYGVLANSGSVNLVDVDERISDLIEDGIMPISNVPVKVFLNNNCIQTHVTSDSSYNASNNEVSISLSNDIQNMEKLTYKGFVYSKKPKSLYQILFNVIANYYGESFYETKYTEFLRHFYEFSKGRPATYIMDDDVYDMFEEAWGELPERTIKALYEAYFEKSSGNLSEEEMIVELWNEGEFIESQITTYEFPTGWFFINMLQENIVYGPSNLYGPITQHLKEINIEYPYIEPEQLFSDVINQICSIAQLQMYLNDEGNIKFTSARPVTGEENFIFIPKSNIMSDFNTELFVKNNFNKVIINQTNIYYENGQIGDRNDITFNAYEEDAWVDKTSEIPEKYKYTEHVDNTLQFYTRKWAELTFEFNFDEIDTKNIKFKYMASYEIKNASDEEIKTSEEYIIKDLPEVVGIIPSDMTPPDDVFLPKYYVYYNDFRKKIILKLSLWVDWTLIGPFNNPANIRTKILKNFSIYLEADKMKSDTVQKTFGDGNNKIEIDGNFLLQNDNISDLMANNILSDYSNGIKTATVTLSGRDVYDREGNIVKDFKNGQLFNVGDVVAFGNQRYKDSSLIKWKMTGRNFKFDGEPLTTIEVMEVKRPIPKLIFEYIDKEYGVKLNPFYKDVETSSTIPDTYNDGINGEYPVTVISNGGFASSNITSVTIPNSVTEIHADSFKNCTGLTSITIPNSVTFIGSNAFLGCTGLTSVTIGNGVVNIGWGAFGECKTLTHITIPNGVTRIETYVFYRCTGLTSVSIPDGVTSIGHYAFSECTGLTSVSIPDSVTSIEEGAFYECRGLTSVSIPDSVTSIGYKAFYRCSGLLSVIFNELNNWYSITNDFLTETSIDVSDPLVNANNLKSGDWTDKILERK